MNIKRVLAGGMAALMAGSTLTFGALAQTAPTWTVGDSADSWFAYNNNDASGASVVYAGAAETEVLAVANGLPLTTTFVEAVAKVRDVTTGTIKRASGTSTAIVGELSRDTIALPTGAAGTLLSAGFPNSGVVTSTHYTGLKASTFDYKGAAYNFREQVDTAGVAFRHGLSVSNINGTEKMVVESSDIIYQFVFEKAVNITAASGTANKGSIASPDYQNPVKIQLLGKDFLIVGVSGNQAKVLQGSVGTGLTKDKGLQYGDYTVFVESGATDNFGTVVFKDKTGKVVVSDTVDQGNDRQFPTLGLTVKLTKIRTSGNEATVVGADLVVGKTGDVEKTYDNSADVSSSGSSSDRFPGETKWGIQTSGLATLGQLSVNDRFDVVYRPSETEYLVAGQSIKLPNNYGELKYEGFNTDSFSTITIKPVTGQAIYNSTDSQTGSGLNGLEISGEVPGSLTTKGGLSGSNAVNKVAFLWNKSLVADSDTVVVVAKWDSTTNKWKANDTLGTTGVLATAYQQNKGATLATDQVPELPVFVNNGTGIFNGSANGAVSESVLLNYTYNLSVRYGASGDQAYNLTTVFSNQTNSATGPKWLAPLYMRIAKPGSAWSLNMSWENKSAATTSQAPEFRLGSSTTTSETTEVVALSEGVTANAGKQSNDVVTDSGLILVNADTNGASDTVKIKVPSKDLLIKARFGAAPVATTGTPMYASTDEALAQVKAGTLTKNLILVGGPCANAVVEELAKADANDTLPTCTEWVGDPAKPKYTKGLIGVWAVGTTGKKALVIAGTLKKDTDDLAAEFKLKGTTAKAAV